MPRHRSAISAGGRPGRTRPGSGIRNATVFGSSCPQAASLLGQPSTNEDCLFLNVFTPLARERGSGSR